MIASRSFDSASRCADESVIEAPKPSIRWKRWDGSIVIVGTPAAGAAIDASDCCFSRFCLSPVVIHTRVPSAPSAGAAPVRPAASARTGST